MGASTSSDLPPGDSRDRTILEAIPLPVFVVDHDLRVIDFNTSADRMLGTQKHLVIRRLGGDMLNCVHSLETSLDCGESEQCKDCIIRKSVGGALHGEQVVRKKARVEALIEGRGQEIELLVTASPFCYREQHLVLLILEDVSELIALRRLLPMCAKCKKIRDDRAYWLQLEEFLTTRLNVDLTHGFCPQCAHEMRVRYDLPESQ